MSHPITLDEIFAMAVKSVELDQLLVLRGLSFRGTIHGAVEFGVKMASGHPDLHRTDGYPFDPQPWASELASRTGTTTVRYPGVWTEIVFPMFGGNFADVGRQAVRALAADYLMTRIQRERPDLVSLDRERYAARDQA
jgi:hypothetical protein